MANTVTYFHGFPVPAQERWTIADVKERSPLLQVQDGDKLYTGYLASHHKRYPTVYYGPISGRMSRNCWTWTAIVRSLNTNTPLKA